MSCEREVKTRNINTIYGDTIFAEKYSIDEATSDWDLKFVVYNSAGREIKTIPFTRLNDKEWQMEEYKENLREGSYNYTLCYTIGSVERLILKGKIKVSKH